MALQYTPKGPFKKVKYRPELNLLTLSLTDIDPSWTFDIAYDDGNGTRHQYSTIQTPGMVVTTNDKGEILVQGPPLHSYQPGTQSIPTQVLAQTTNQDDDNNQRKVDQNDTEPSTTLPRRELTNPPSMKTSNPTTLTRHHNHR